jgi:hypothetical protein
MRSLRSPPPYNISATYPVVPHRVSVIEGLSPILGSIPILLLNRGWIRYSFRYRAYTISPRAIFSKMSFKLISDIHPSNSLLFHYLKAPVLKRILGSTFVS